MLSNQPTDPLEQIPALKANNLFCDQESPLIL